MPFGVICCSSAILIGGIIGGCMKNQFPDRLKDPMFVIFGICAIGIGILSLEQVNSLPSAMFAVILGMLIGEGIGMEGRIKAGFYWVIRKMKFPIEGDHDTYMRSYLIVAAIFCASGTNIFGAVNEGMRGDMTILVSKAVMDIFASMIFAVILGYAVCILAVPQFIILSGCFFVGKFLLSWVSEPIMADFVATGGILTICLGITVSGIKEIKAINLLPSLILIFPISYVFHLIPW